ncbi:MAG: class I SAM-dependent methyltransferase [bacterium]|nr:class I SAM-dependent methyltransferase [bacterium]
MDKLTEYYSKRVKEMENYYESIYHRDEPVRQGEQRDITKAIKKNFSGRKVLEVACGTGYWTTFLSEVAKSIVAIDSSEAVLTSAKSKTYKCKITFRKGNAYKLPFTEGEFDGGLANFWFSHIPKSKIKSFLNNFHRVLKDKAIVFMCDNIFNEGVGGKLINGGKGDNNTYKIRTLEDNKEYKILKNYYSEKQIVDILGKNVSIVDIYFGKCFWYVCYEVKKKQG